jgi:hypothetical protein
VSAVSIVREELGKDARRGVEVRQRLEQRHDLKADAHPAQRARSTTASTSAVPRVIEMMNGPRRARP